MGTLEKRTMIKVPCGGFKLDNNFLGMNENDELSLTGGSKGKAYQYLVTDGEGTVKWEDKLVYEEVKKYSLPHNTSGLESAQIGPSLSTYYKVSDDLPDPNDVIQGALYSGPDGIYLDAKVSDGYENNVNCLYDTNVGAFIICYQTSVTFFNKTYSVPSTGVYLSATINDMGDGDMYLQVQHVNTIDKKFIPSELNEMILPSSTSGSSKKFKITVDDTGTISATEVTS